MANISTYITQIESASRGEQVRDSIVSALEAVNSEAENPVVTSTTETSLTGFLYGNGSVVSTATPSVSSTTGTDLTGYLYGNGTTITTASPLPSVTTTDEGKFLRVDSTGAWAAESVPNAEEGSF